ncbi:MAG TPA: VWA domain-containing protein [Bacteroidia bacterium]|nr:VWA domain-containing protein [Bacteroidia bacterium]
MRRFTFLFYLLLFSVCTGAQQNLVPNPSFEEPGAPVIQKFNWGRYKDWKRDSLDYRTKNYLCKDWFQVTDGTPDYLNSDQSWLLGWKTKTARTGDGRMAIIGGLAKNSLVSWLLYSDTYAEYVECRLLQPLEAGKTYRVEYYVALDRKSNFACHAFGAAITKDCVTVSNYHACMWGYDPYAQVINSNDHYITSDEGWVMVCDTFVAKGGERFLTLGTFAGDFPKRVHSVKRSQHGGLRVAPFNKYSYYYVDDVSLTEVLPGQPVCMTPRDTVPRDNVVFLIDVSGSMQQKGLIDEAKRSILPFVNTLSVNDHVTILAFSGNVQVLCEQVPASDTATIRDALDHLSAGGATNAKGAFDAAYASVRKKMIPGGTNKIVVLTDGQIYLDKKEKKKIRAAVKDEGITVSVVFFGEKVPEQVQKFAESAGGTAANATGGTTQNALQNVVPAKIDDTPYGQRNAGKIFTYELLTKALLPGLLALLLFGKFIFSH